MTPLLLAAAVALAGPGPACLGPDLLNHVGSFEVWPTPIDPEGWDRLSFGNGVLYTYVQSRGQLRRSAAFQTAYGPAELSKGLQLATENWLLSAWVDGQLPRTVAVQVKDLDSGRYLTPAGTWQDAPADAIVQQEVSGFLRQISLPFATEGAGRHVTVTVRSLSFGVCAASGFCDCSPGLCPTGWVDNVRLCAR